MGKRLFVGGIPYSTTEQELGDLFGRYGTVTDIHIPVDRYTGQAKGFAFVEMGSNAEADSATEGLNQTMMGSRQIVVNEAREKPQSGYRDAEDYGSRQDESRHGSGHHGNGGHRR